MRTIAGLVALFTVGAILSASGAWAQYPSPTPTTPTPSVSPTGAVSPTVSPTVVTEEEGQPPTVAGEEVGEAGPAGAQEGEVAFTGAELAVLLVVLMALVGLGLGLYVLGRRRARTSG